MPTNKANADLIKDKSDVIGSCWVWSGFKNPKGYGTVRVNGKLWLAHRLSYFVFNGSIDDNLLVRHTCDNSSCVNPEHLLQGTNQDNINDAKKRNRFKFGQNHCKSKLMNQDVVDIRVAWWIDKISISSLAAHYKVSSSCIRDIITGRKWKGV